MDKYKHLICKVMELVQEAAKLTGETWDDALAQIAHDVICRWLGVVHEAKAHGYQSTELVGRFGFTSDETKAIPEWLKKVLLAIAQVLPYLL